MNLVFPVSVLFSRAEFLLHPAQYRFCFILTHAGIFESGEPFTHEVRAFAAVGEFPLIDAAVVYRAYVNSNKTRPEWFSTCGFASPARIAMVVAVAA